MPTLSVLVVASLAVTFSNLMFSQKGVVLLTEDPVSVAGLEGRVG